MRTRRSHARRLRAWETPDGGLRWWVFALAAVILLGAGRLATDGASAPAHRTSLDDRDGARATAAASSAAAAAPTAAAVSTGATGATGGAGSPPAGTGSRPAGSEEAPAGPAASASAAVSPSTVLASPPACRFGSKRALHAGEDDWALTLVDTTYRLGADDVPPDLVPVDRAGVGGWGSVRAFVIDDLRAMATAAAEAGVPFTVQSAYRSFTRQAAVFDGWVASAGEASALRSSARAGHSEHQLGTTLDLRVEGGPEPWNGSFATTPTGHWLRDNAWHYGFIVSYPEGSDDVTCYAGEAWHVRYVGRDEAAAVSASGVTLREWLWANR